MAIMNLIKAKAEEVKFHARRGNIGAMASLIGLIALLFVGSIMYSTQQDVMNDMNVTSNGFSTAMDTAANTAQTFTSAYGGYLVILLFMGILTAFGIGVATKRR